MSQSKLREKIAQEFVNSLNEDRIPWKAAWAAERPYNATTDKDYNGLNSLWLSYVAGQKGYTDPRWATFKQAKDHNWNVRKGEHGTQIEFWSMYDTKNRKNLSMSEARGIIKAEPEREKDFVPNSKCYTVFNAEQLDGIPKLAERQSTIDIEAVRGQRDTLIKNMGLTFVEGGNEAYYKGLRDTITMPPDTAFESTYEYMATFLHEASHATGHPSRLRRDLGGKFGSEKYAKEELRAEISSAMLSQTLGFGTDLCAEMTNHKAYVQSWAQVIKDKPTELFAAIKDAENICDYLIEKGQFQLPERAQTAPEMAPEERAVQTLEKPHKVR